MILINFFYYYISFLKKLQAVLEISKIFVQREGCVCTLSPRFMGEVLSEERASYNSLEMGGNIQEGNFLRGNFPGGSLMGGYFLDGNFLVGNFQEEFSRGELDG